MPVPSSTMIRKLNALSSGLGWGDLDGRTKLFDDGSAPAMYWCSDIRGDMTLDIHANQRAMTRSEIACGKRALQMLQIHAVSTRFRIHAGPVFFSLPSIEGIPALVQTLSPLLHVENFDSKASRMDLVRRYPTTVIPKIRPPLWKSTAMKIIDGQIVVDEGKRLYWKRRFAQFKRRATGPV